ETKRRKEKKKTLFFASFCYFLSPQPSPTPAFYFFQAAIYVFLVFLLFRFLLSLQLSFSVWSVCRKKEQNLTGNINQHCQLSYKTANRVEQRLNTEKKRGE